MSVTVYTSVCAVCHKPVQRVDAKTWISAPTVPGAGEVRNVQFVIEPCQHCLGIAESRGRRQGRDDARSPF